MWSWRSVPTGSTIGSNIMVSFLASAFARPLPLLPTCPGLQATSSILLFPSSVIEPFVLSTKLKIVIDIFKVFNCRLYVWADPYRSAILLVVLRTSAHLLITNISAWKMARLQKEIEAVPYLGFRPIGVPNFAMLESKPCPPFLSSREINCVSLSYGFKRFDSIMGLI